MDKKVNDDNNDDNADAAPDEDDSKIYVFSEVPVQSPVILTAALPLPQPALFLV
jgi:hypothetical protein